MTLPMNLTDSEIIELNDLCSALVDGTLADADKQRLSQWLSTSEAAREYYVRVLGLSADLCHYAAEVQTEESDALVAPGKSGRRWWMFGIPLALAASIALMMVVRRPPSATPVTQVAATDAENEFVARLTGAKNCEWLDGASFIQPGGRLRKGQHVALAKGYAEITFDSGAQVLLQGPASMDVNSAWSATLNHGSLKANLPPEAMGFSISNPTVQVVDIGTEFAMVVDVGGASTDVLVLKGEVEAAPRQPSEQPPILLKEKDFRRFASTGVSTLHEGATRFDELSKPVVLDRFVQPIGFARWSFDDEQGDIFKAFSFGLPVNAPDAKLENVASEMVSSSHTQGRWRGALRFDGKLYARAAFPRISENGPHTVAFWAKIPKDATLSSAYAMVAWRANNPKFGSHPFHVGWNRNPNEGLVGALRTDYGGGFAMGATPLRDGQWHHIAIVFIPRTNAESPMEVKQYVDGRLEGEGKPSPPGSDIFKSSENSALTMNGTIWLGCRLGTKDVRADRFYGEMDELLIADRALEPQEIVRLMTLNHFDE